MFKEALSLTLAFEGGFSDDPNDPGGRTNFGITQATYDPTRNRDVKNITMPEVNHIYEEEYWNASSANRIDPISPALAAIHFDNAVNCGVTTAIMMLQGVLGVQKDGIVGPMTLSFVTNSPSLQLKYLQARQDRYDHLIARRPQFEEFKKSWYHRLNVLANHFDLPFHV